MATMQLNVCDVCGDPTRPTVRYRVSGDERSATVDFCEEHGSCLAEILEAHGDSRTRRGRLADYKVASMEEIEALKRKTADRHHKAKE